MSYAPLPLTKPRQPVYHLKAVRLITTLGFSFSSDIHKLLPPTCPLPINRRSLIVSKYWLPPGTYHSPLPVHYLLDLPIQFLQWRRRGLEWPLRGLFCVLLLFQGSGAVTATMEVVTNLDVGAVGKAVKRAILTKQSEVILFSSTSIALYGFDQGLMSLINTNYDYLDTMGIGEESPIVSIVVSVYYLGCAAGSIVSSKLADRKGRKTGISFCLSLTVLGNLLMFVAGLGYRTGALWVMIAGRIVMGLGVGGIDSVIPVYSAELNDEGNRGRAMAQEFQANILGLNVAFGLNLAVTRGLGKFNQWAWRTPIIFMQIFPVFLGLIFHRLPESPRWLLSKERDENARTALEDIYEADNVEDEFKRLKSAKEEESSKPVSYADMLVTGGSQFHPTMITIMGQVNQALTGYGKAPLPLPFLRQPVLTIWVLRMYLCLWASDLWAPWVLRRSCREHRPGQLHILLRHDDLLVAPYRRRGPTKTHDLVLGHPRCKFCPFGCLWWSGYVR